MRKLGTFAVAALAVALAAGRAGAQEYKPPAKWEAAGLTITPNDFKMESDRLIMKFVLWNKTERQIVVDRDLLELKTSDGRTMKRYKGMMTGWGMSDSRHTINAGDHHDVEVQFVVGKGGPPSANLQFKNAVVSEGTTITLPDFVVTRK